MSHLPEGNQSGRQHQRKILMNYLLYRPLAIESLIHWNNYDKSLLLPRLFDLGLFLDQRCMIHDLSVLNQSTHSGYPLQAIFPSFVFVFSRLLYFKALGYSPPPRFERTHRSLRQKITSNLLPVYVLLKPNTQYLVLFGWPFQGPSYLTGLANHFGIHHFSPPHCYLFRSGFKCLPQHQPVHYTWLNN